MYNINKKNLLFGAATLSSVYSKTNRPYSYIKYYQDITHTTMLAYCSFWFFKNYDFIKLVLSCQMYQLNLRPNK